jgi:tetratricopeptide (TPR) repeat protein
MSMDTLLINYFPVAKDNPKHKYTFLAIDDFNMALKLKPDLADAHYYLAFCYCKIGELELASHSIDKAIELNHPNADMCKVIQLHILESRITKQKAEEFAKNCSKL